MTTSHDCDGWNRKDHPPMNIGTEIVKRWFGWTIEKKGQEIRITFCPFCGANLEEQR